MKRITLVLIILASLLKPVNCNAQSDFFFNVYGGSTNYWSSIYLQLPVALINGAISSALDEDEAIGGTLRYDIFKIKNAGEKVSIDNGNYFGFKGKDMFSNVQYGLKFGWQPDVSPIGIYVSCAYQFDKFKAQFDSNINEWEKFKMHSVRPGIGLRVTPFINMLEDDGWSPIFEIGTSYNYYFNCTAPFDSNKEQFNSGMISTFAVGSRFEENYSISAGVEISHYSMFNQDFTPDGISFPYKDMKSSKWTIFLSVAHDF